MSPTKREKILTRVQKIRALAESERANGNSTAADSQMAIAAKMMLEHALSERDLDTHDPSADPMIKRNVRTGRQLRWIRTLYHSVAKSNNCTTSYTPRTDRVTFYGTEGDIDVAEYLATYLLRTVSRSIQQAAVRAKINGEHFDRHGYANSMVSALHYRLDAMRREAADDLRKTAGDEAVSTALVVVKNKLQRAQDFADSHGLGKGSSSRYTHDPAGYAAGKRVPIHQGLGGGSAPAKKLA